MSDTTKTLQNLKDDLDDLETAVLTDEQEEEAQRLADANTISDLRSQLATAEQERDEAKANALDQETINALDAKVQSIRAAITKKADTNDTPTEPTV